MKNTLLLAIFFISISIFAGNPNDLKSAETKAKSENKLILLKFSGSDWCIPCIHLQKQVLDSEDFKIFSDKNLVMMNADFPRLKKNKLSATDQKINNNLAEKYNKEGIFPKLLLINADGKVLAHWEGIDKITSQELKRKISPFLGK